jgi:hypothetical protein
VKATLTEKDRKELFPGGWKPLYWALFAYVILVPLAYLMATIVPGRKDWPLWAYTTVMHALLCAVVAAGCKVMVSIVEQWIPKSRLRPHTGHIRNFIGVLAVWPFCVAVFMVVWKLKHG